MRERLTIQPDTFADQRVLITGAAGFIGSHLARLCVDAGADVIGVGRSGVTDAIEPSIDWRQVDLADPAATQALIDETRPSMIFDLAGHASASRSPEAILPTLASNLVSTVNLLHSAQRLGASGTPRIVLAGSLEESTAGDIPNSPYAASKTAQTLYARMFHHLYQTPITIARTFMVYGPAQADTRKLVPFVINALLNNESPPLASGTREVDWVYVEDVARGYLACALSRDAIGQTIDIASGSAVSIRAVVEMIVELMQTSVQPRFGAIPDRPLEQVCVGDIERSFALTGWRPQHSLQDGLQKTIAWYRAQHLSAEQRAMTWNVDRPASDVSTSQLDSA